MKLTRHYYIGDDLDELEVFEQELESAGILTPQIHILTHADAEAENRRNIHSVNSFMKKDVVRSAQIGAVFGVLMAALVIIGTYLSGIASTITWVPAVFLAIVLFGFCTWEGGLFGIQEPNNHFRRFKQALEQGKHIFFVDLEPEQEQLFTDLVKSHPNLRSAGTGSFTPRWIPTLRHRFMTFMKAMP